MQTYITIVFERTRKLFGDLSPFSKSAFCLVLIFFAHSSSSQTTFDTLFHNLDPQKWSVSISKQMDRSQEKLISKSEKTLRKLEVREERLYKKMLHSKDSLAARSQLADIQNKYKTMREGLNKPASLSYPNAGRQYLPRLDTITTALKFLDQGGIGGTIKDALIKTSSFYSRLEQAEEIKKFIRERREQLKAQLEQLGLVKDLKRFNKEVYYYGQELNDIRETLKDSKKGERKALELLSKTKPFKDFMRKNGMLVTLFGLPSNPSDQGAQMNLTGLQTRAQINNLIQQQLVIAGPNAAQQFQQNLQTAQGQLNEFKNRFGRFNNGNVDDEIPNFKPNTQKTRSFLKRLEFGTNMQSQKANNFFPVTSDLGLSLGYKLSDKSVIGIGASYKLGWGRGWNNIRLSSQGVGLRTYADIKLKGSFWISGGYEQNYRSAFNDFDELRNKNAWQESGLLGLSKKYKFSKKYSGKIQLLWDFMSYTQIPRTQPIIFRIGFSLK